MNSLIDYLAYLVVKIVGVFIRLMPAGLALGVGRLMGLIAYYVDMKRKSLVYLNLKVAFAQDKKPQEIKRLTKKFFMNFGQNIIELFRLPLMNTQNFENFVEVVGKENVDEGAKQGKGIILLAMHYGSWEIASLAPAMMGRPYKVFVRPQPRFKRLNNLLNSYRTSTGANIIERGMGVRGLINCLKNNEVIGMVVDQGGRDGTLMPFFDRQASMAVGAIRLALKMDVVLCFSIIVRQKGARHRLIIHTPLKLIKTGNMEKDIKANLAQLTPLMEDYIRKGPEEYMWFYKIWKYSKESVIAILNDGKTGHLRQSQAIANSLAVLLQDKGMKTAIKTFDVGFKNDFLRKLFSLAVPLVHNILYTTRLNFIKKFLTKGSFQQVVSSKADFIISCGSATAGLNYLLSEDQQAKAIVILKPGMLNIKKFDAVILPQHDKPKLRDNVIITKGAPNLINKKYLEEQSEQLLKRFSHLKIGGGYKVGLLLGGDTKNHVLSEKSVRIMINQLKELANEEMVELLVTTSRRTPAKIESLLQRELRKYPRCRLLIIANQHNVPEAVGGILGVADAVVVSGDSISMISEAASSGKPTLVFPMEERLNNSKATMKHNSFIDMLNEQNFILSTEPQNLKESLYNIAKNKIQLIKLDDYSLIAEGLKNLI
jgi:KDO2-lipid IV(A) lauroyltransferase